MSDVFREVDDDIRRERASEFWKRYGTIVIVVAALIVVGIGGWRLYDYWQDQRAAAFGDRYAAAIALAEAGDDEGARAAFAALAADSAGGYPVLARLATAAEQAKAGDVEGAAAAYRTVAAEADGPMADIARLRAAYLMVGRDSTDAVMAVLGRTVDQNNPFYLSRRRCSVSRPGRARTWRWPRPTSSPTSPLPTHRRACARGPRSCSTSSPAAAARRPASRPCRPPRRPPPSIRRR